MKSIVKPWKILILVILAVATVSVRLSIVKTSYAVSQVERQIQNSKLQKENSRIHLAGLRSPRRLESLSKTQFKLNQPRVDQVIYIR